MSRIISASRYLIIIPVVCIFLAALILLVAGALGTFQATSAAFSAGFTLKSSKELLLRFIELVDIFLLSTVLYVIAVGLYELFIDDNLPLPPWLVIRNLDDLKNNLIGVVIVVLGVLFLGQMISWDGQRDLLNPGVAAALVIVALSYFLSLKGKKGAKEE